MTRFILYTGLLPLICLPVWAAAGIYPPWQFILFPLTAIAWLSFILAPRSGKFPGLFRRVQKLFADPSFWCALGFIGFLAIQFSNSGRISTYNFDSYQYEYSAPDYPYLPWSFSALESVEMFRWFVPVLSLFLILKHTRSVVSLRKLAVWMCINGFAVAILALYGNLQGWKLMYNRFYFGRDVFGSFSYPNNAATYFLICTGLSLGFAMRKMRKPSGFIKKTYGVLWWALVFLFLFTLFETGSGAGKLFIIALPSLWAMIYWFKKQTDGFNKRHLARGLIIGLVFISLLMVAGNFIRSDKIQRPVSRAAGAMSSRFYQSKAAVEMWLDHPFYGVGGWGYRYLVAYYKPPEHWNMRIKGGGNEPAREANVHNDFLQFLAEFGLIGMGLLGGTFAPVIKQGWRNVWGDRQRRQIFWQSSIQVWAFITLILVLAHSMIDLPFRSPALFMHAVVLLFIVGAEKK